MVNSAYPNHIVWSRLHRDHNLEALQHSCDSATRLQHTGAGAPLAEASIHCSGRSRKTSGRMRYRKGDRAARLKPSLSAGYPAYVPDSTLAARKSRWKAAGPVRCLLYTLRRLGRHVAGHRHCDVGCAARVARHRLRSRRADSLSGIRPSQDRLPARASRSSLAFSGLYDRAIRHHQRVKLTGFCPSRRFGGSLRRLHIREFRRRSTVKSQRANSGFS